MQGGSTWHRAWRRDAEGDMFGLAERLGKGEVASVD